MGFQEKSRNDLRVVTKQEAPAPKKKLRLSNNKFPIFVLLLFLAFLIFSYGGQLNKLHAMSQDVENMKMQISDIKSKNEELRETLSKARTEAYIEKIAREELGLIREGEMLIVPLDPSNPGEAPSASQQIIRD